MPLVTHGSRIWIHRLRFTPLAAFSEVFITDNTAHNSVSPLEALLTEAVSNITNLKHIYTPAHNV